MLAESKIFKGEKSRKVSKISKSKMKMGEKCRKVDKYIFSKAGMTWNVLSL